MVNTNVKFSDVDDVDNSIKVVTANLIQAYRNFHKTKDASHADTPVGEIEWDADGNPFQITKIQYSEMEITRIEAELCEHERQRWDIMFPTEEAA
jgi:hypothetical protein